MQKEAKLKRMHGKVTKVTQIKKVDSRRKNGKIHGNCQSAFSKVSATCNSLAFAAFSDLFKNL